MKTRTKPEWKVRMRSYVPARLGAGDAIEVYEVLYGRKIVFASMSEVEAYGYYRSAKYADGQGPQDKRGEQ